MRKPLLGDLDSIPSKITRALEHGPDYQPDWRHLQVREYLNSIYQPDAELLTRLDEILEEESDPFVRDLLLFHCGRPCGNEEGIAYAVKCQRDNSNTLSASAIKALVIANVSPERIAHEFGTTKEKIETFEKLYFDARRYLKHRGWLKGICFPAAKPNADVAIESRWLAVAFRRGWPGVEEVVLGQTPKSGQRTIEHPFSIFLGRVEDYCFRLEASGAAPSEDDVKALCALARIHARGLPYLWENPLEQEASTDDPTNQALKELSPAERDSVYFFLKAVIDAAEKKVLAQKSEASM
jgi:hypothetical protein